MKRTIAGVLLLIGMGAGTVFADDGWRERRDVRHDKVKINYDRRELRGDIFAEIIVRPTTSAGR